MQTGVPPSLAPFARRQESRELAFKVRSGITGHERPTCSLQAVIPSKPRRLSRGHSRNASTRATSRGGLILCPAASSHHSAVCPIPSRLVFNRWTTTSPIQRKAILRPSVKLKWLTIFASKSAAKICVYSREQDQVYRLPGHASTHSASSVPT